jgi:3-isopropylmalate/(R)-2-methylmalate dehydratase large subunit
MTIIEKIMAKHSRNQADSVQPGDIAVVDVDRLILIDLTFYPGFWYEPKEVYDPEKIALIFDHLVPVPNRESAEFLENARRFAKRVGIEAIHDVGPEQGIAHAIIAEVPYAFPGQILVCADSHTCSAGALNCAARGLGPPEIAFILAQGYTWFEVPGTVRYNLTGELGSGVASKDVFLYLAAEYGDHAGQSTEFGGSGMANLTLDQRRQLTTMTAEISADFGICEPDELLAEHMAARGYGMEEAAYPDADAHYDDIRSLDLSSVEPMVGLTDSLVHNAVPVSEVPRTKINRAFIGSCANGTLDDLREAAAVLDGHRVADGVTLLVTPASQKIYRQALAEGVIERLSSAGALVTASSCGMCSGLENALTADDVCIASSPRNFKGRMGSTDAEIYIGSSGTVAASAVTGEIDGAAAISSGVPA